MKQACWHTRTNAACLWLTSSPVLPGRTHSHTCTLSHMHTLSHTHAHTHFCDTHSSLTLYHSPSSGPIEAASNTETNVMQAVQAAIIAAAAAEHHNQQQQRRQHQNAGASGSNADNNAGATSSSTTSSSTTPAQGPPQQQPPPPLSLFSNVKLDRTERLANSLGRMVWVVQQLNNMQHGFKIMLMAGKEGLRWLRGGRCLFCVFRRLCVTCCLTRFDQHWLSTDTGVSL